MPHTPTHLQSRIGLDVDSSLSEQFDGNAAMESQDGRGAFHVLERPFQITDSYPDVMTPADMQRAFRIGETRFYALLKRGVFDRFEIRPPIGRRAWSGALVANYLRAGGLARGFGRKRA